MAEFNIEHVAKLARIALTPDEKAHLGTQLNQILAYIAQLESVDVSGVEPTAHAIPLVNVLRPDIVRESLSHEEAMKNAPARANGLFIVPKIVE